MWVLGRSDASQLMGNRSPAPVPGLATRLESALVSDLATDFRESVAPNTWRAYSSDLTDFEDWCASKRRRWSKPETVAAYFRALEAAGASYSTIERRKTAIAKAVEAEALLGDGDIEDPTKHPKTLVTLRAIRRRLGTDQRQAKPLTGERLIQVLLAIDQTSLAGQRDLALLLVGFFGAMRRSELAGMRLDHLEFDSHGVGIELPTSKTSQTGSVWVPIHRQPNSRWDPVGALERWLETVSSCEPAHLSDGVWLRVTKGDTFVRGSKPISADAINNIVCRRVLAAGLPEASAFSAHSLRSGFVTEAKNRGIDEADIMKHSRHKSLQQMRSYDRTSGWWNRNATASLSL